MGYRSDVAYAIQFPSKDELVVFLARVRMDASQVGELDKLMVAKTRPWADPNECYVLLFHEESVKWYEDSYEDVQWHMRLIQAAAEQGYPTRYVRVGEEQGDVEIKDTGETECSVLDMFVDVRTEVDFTPGMAMKEFMQRSDNDESE